VTTATSPLAERAARDLRDELSLAEKLHMLAGDSEMWPTLLRMTREGGSPAAWTAGALPARGIAGIRFTDGPRGVTLGTATCFPVPMARGATFDPGLEERVGEAMGREARAAGANLLGAVCVNVLRHPGWGRAQETYGEDPVHLGLMGSALTRGIQRHVMACVKHYALNSIENSRHTVDVRASPDVLDGVYLPQFEAVVREGVASVMSAYNSVNGEWCGQNHELLTTILKQRWGFDGFVVSDWLFGIRDGVKAINAGMDLEMPHCIFFAGLADAVARGDVALSRIDDAVLRLLRQQLRFADVGDGEYGPEVLACAEHRALAREVATRSIVLLRNERVDGAPVLPLNVSRLTSLAVVGRLAGTPNTGDRGSSNVRPPYVVTPLQGLREVLAPLGVTVTYDDGTDTARAARTAAGADAVIIVAGYTYLDEGEGMGTQFPPPAFAGLLPPVPPELSAEVVAALAAMTANETAMGVGGDRASLSLHEADERLISEVASANPRVIVAIMCGSAVLMERWRNLVPGILILWYPGMEGGHALADIVLGERAPTGRLPFAIPVSQDHLPPFDPGVGTVEYGPLHGQRLLDHLGVRAAYPHGFGLTYG
jgi:beta-glucosidase